MSSPYLQTEALALVLLVCVHCSVCTHGNQCRGIRRKWCCLANVSAHTPSGRYLPHFTAGQQRDAPHVQRVRSHARHADGSAHG